MNNIIQTELLIHDNVETHYVMRMATEEGNEETEQNNILLPVTQTKESR